MIEYRTKSMPMPMFKAGDHVKVEFKDEQTGESRALQQTHSTKKNECQCRFMSSSTQDFS